jgi:HD-GYP domain-containing protein (c-di-GMP phosphodiesterase class II)
LQKREVSVNELRFGMYVAELDRPWTDTPFPFQGFLLRNQTQVEALRRFCKRVYVDVERSDPGVIAKLAAQPPPPKPAAESLRGSTVYEETASLEYEFVRARDIYAESAAFIDDVLDWAQTGKVLDGRRLREAVSNITDCIVRNPDALLLVSRLRGKGTYTLSHSLDVSIYMAVFGRFLQLPREDIDMLGLLGLLQDIGKVKLPNALLEKKGPLTPEEYELAKTHVAHSVEQLRETPNLPPGLPDLAALHHERHDGSGYPKGLKGIEIALYGSIAAITDTFDALTKSRPYAGEISPSNALGVLHKARATQYHEALVEQFIQCVGIFPVGSVVELNTGEIGIVIAQNLVRRLKPRVMVVLDAQGQPMRPQKILDLVNEPMATPDEPYRIRRTLEHGKLRVDPAEFFL